MGNFLMQKNVSFGSNFAANQHRLCFEFLARAVPIFLVCSAVSAYSADYDWRALNRGDVIIDSVEDEQGVPGVRAVFTIRAQREEIWATLVDYDNFPHLFEGVDRIKVLESDESGARVEFWVDAILTDLHYVLHRDYEEPGHRLTWKRVSGDTEDIHGSWEILDTPDSESKLLIYESFVDIGSYVATLTIRLGAKKKARNMAYRLREWIENIE